MRIRPIIAIVAMCLFGFQAMADVAKHTTASTDGSGKVVDITEMVADDNGKLRMEMYEADASGNRGTLDSYIVFDAAANKMLTYTDGMCQVMDLTGDELPGGMTRDDVTAAQAEMQQALEQMRRENPEMAKMLEAQMGSGMAAMLGGEPPEIQVVETGEEREIGDYDTRRFRIDGMPGSGNYTVWAADIDDVDGGRTMARASKAMMQAYKQMMDNMGMGNMFGSNTFSEMLEVMEDYYPIESGDGSLTTRLVSTDGAGATDFDMTCD